MLLCFMGTSMNVMSQITYHIIKNDISCFGYNDGLIWFDSAAGGTYPLQYSKDSGASWQSTATFNQQNAGVYNMLIKDATGNLSTATQIILTQPTQVTFTTSVTNATCISCYDGIITVSATGGNSAYTFYIDTSSIQQLSNVFNGLSPGMHVISVNDAPWCSGGVDTVIVGVNSGILEINLENEILIFPNPTTNTITISAQSGIRNYDLRITDVLGNMVYHQAPSISTQSTINISHWSKGIYLVHLQSDKESLVKRVVVE